MKKPKDKFKKNDIVRFKIGNRIFSGNIVKAYHPRRGGTWYLVMTDYEIVDEKELKLKE